MNEPQLAPVLALDVPMPFGRRDDSTKLFFECKPVLGANRSSSSGDWRSELESGGWFTISVSDLVQLLEKRCEPATLDLTAVRGGVN